MGVKGEVFRVGRVIGRSFLVLARNIAPVGLLALAMLSLPYVLGHLLGIRYFGGPFFELSTGAWSWREALAMTLKYFLAACRCSQSECTRRCKAIVPALGRRFDAALSDSQGCLLSRSW